MSIEYDNKFESGTIYCDGNKDGCMGQAVFDGEFKSVVDQAKTMGWKIKNDGGEYFHYCSVCVE